MSSKTASAVLVSCVSQAAWSVTMGIRRANGKTV